MPILEKDRVVIEVHLKTEAIKGTDGSFVPSRKTTLPLFSDDPVIIAGINAEAMSSELFGTASPRGLAIHILSAKLALRVREWLLPMMSKATSFDVYQQAAIVESLTVRMDVKLPGEPHFTPHHLDRLWEVTMPLKRLPDEWDGPSMDRRLPDDRNEEQSRRFKARLQEVLKGYFSLSLEKILKRLDSTSVPETPS